MICCLSQSRLSKPRAGNRPFFVPDFGRAFFCLFYFKPKFYLGNGHCSNAIALSTSGFSVLRNTQNST